MYSKIVSSSGLLKMPRLCASLLVILSLSPLQAFVTREAFRQIVTGDCGDVYGKDSDNCSDGCGRCFNGEGRSSTPDFDVVMCPAENGSPGYYCDPEGGVFACMDWTFGSNKIKEQEQKFNSRTWVVVVEILWMSAYKDCMAGKKVTIEMPPLGDLSTLLSWMKTATSSTSPASWTKLQTF